MLTRSQRSPLHTTTTTAAVGPGAYETGVAPLGRLPNHAVAPFGSTTNRGTGMVSPDGAPGPGTYFNDAVHGAKAGKMRPSPQFASKQARIPLDRASLEARDLPGPGAYTAELVSVAPPKRAPAGGPASMHQAEGINWVKVATAPSIPDRTQSYGYEVGAGGTLVLQSAPYKGHTGTRGDVAGPGEYEPSDRLLRRARHAPNFGASAARPSATDRDSATRPGPGSYDQAVCGTGDAFRGGVMAQRQSSSFASTSKRNTTQIVPGPGPGAYRTPSTFAPLREHLAAHPETFSAFGATIADPSRRREDLLAADPPGPGAYDVTVDITAANSTRQKGLSSLQSKAPRFAASAPGGGGPRGDAPGPGAYGVAETETMVARLGRRVNGRFGAFGSTSGRFSKEPEGAGGAGPGAYNPPAALPNPAESRRRDQRSAAFRSASSRTDLARPAQTQCATAFYAPPSDWPKPVSSSRAFINNQPRFTDSKPATDVPGPGQYDAKLPARKTAASGNDFGRASRFEAQKVESTPGPGTYDSTPSLVRRTFNISIGA